MRSVLRASALSTGVALLCAGWPVSASAQSSTGPLLLLVPATPRTAALGNAWVAGRDQEVLFYNPAQLIGARQGLDLSITRHGGEGTTWGLGSVYAGGKWSLTLGWGAAFADFSPSPGTPYPYAPDVLLARGSASGSSALAAVGGAITYKGFRMGAAGKYAADHIAMPADAGTASIDEHAWVLDAGVARNMFGGVGAASIQNLRGGSYDGEPRLALPRQVLLGWSRQKQAGQLDLGIYTQVLVRGGWVSPSGGLEVGYGWIEGYYVALRVGGRRPDADTEQPVTFGAAFTADRLTVEYGVQFFDGGRAANGVTIRWR
jgi:hypothetical protein